MKPSTTFTAQKLAGYNAVAIAYIGDAVYNLFVRTRLIEERDAQSGKLQAQSGKIVSARMQAQAALKIKEILTEEETAIFKRARNAKKTSTAKNASASEYSNSTGIEAVFGYLYLKNEQTRLYELLNIAFEESK